MIANDRRPRLYRIAASVLAASIFALFVISPVVRHWRERERIIGERSARLAKLEWLVAHRNDSANSGAADAEAIGSGRILSGRSVAVAASALQSVIQRYADESGMTLNRLDVTNAPDSSAAEFPIIPCSVAAVGDIVGLTEFLAALRQGRPALNIEGMSIVSTSALGNGVLQVSLNILAPAAIRP